MSDRRSMAFLFIAGLGIVSLAQTFAWTIGQTRSERIDDRFAFVAALVSPATTLGHLTDLEPGWSEARLQYQARFALAPRPIVKGASPDLVLAEVADPSSIERLCRANGLRVVRQSGGVFLLEHERAPR